MAPFERLLLLSTAEIWKLESQATDRHEWEERMLMYLFNHRDITYQIQDLLSDDLTDWGRFCDLIDGLKAALESFRDYSSNNNRHFRAEQLRYGKNFSVA